MQQPVVVFRAASRRACEERAFVLTAVGIDSQVDIESDGYCLLVEQPVLAHAQHHLWQYEEERHRRPPPAMPLRPQPGAWRGSLFYCIVLLLPPILLAQGLFRVDPYESATLHPGLVRDGEWWRALTALTLHWDFQHLLGNLGGGALLGYSAAQVWGSARAWLLVLVSAAAANFIEALLGVSGNYVSAGASTAVFAALGLVVAAAWRARGRHVGSPLARWAPLVAGLAMLGFFGAGSSVPVAGMPLPQPLPFEEPVSTNVLSHLLGFICGVVVGAITSGVRGSRMLGALPAWAAVAGTLAPLLLAWLFAQSI
jgi:rhomboid protease GluP